MFEGNSPFSTPDPAGWPALPFSRPGRIAQAARRVGHAFVQRGARRRIGEPIAAVLMARDVVRRIEVLALVEFGDHADRAVMFVAHDAARRDARTRADAPG